MAGYNSAMPPLSAVQPTGRKQLGPASDLIEMQDKSGALYTAIQFHPEYRSHNALNSALSVAIGFLENPMVSGLSSNATSSGLGEVKGWCMAK